MVHDAKSRTSHQIDVVAFARDSGGGRSALLLGEAKWGRRMDRGDLARLRWVREVPGERGVVAVGDCRLACFSGVGFARELRAAERAGEVVLVDLERLYRGE